MLKLLEFCNEHKVRSDIGTNGTDWKFCTLLYRLFATTVSQLKICDFFRRSFLKVLKCHNFLWVKQRHNRSPAASFADCVMTLYRLKVHLQKFRSVPITQKFQILSCDTLVANEGYVIKVCKSIAQSVALVNRKFWFYFLLIWM